MATTPILALPYPLDTDRVTDGDNAIRALAERLEAKMPRGNLAHIETQVVTSGIGVTPVQLTGLTTTVTVPANRLIRVSGLVTFGQPTGNGIANLDIYDGAASIQSVFISLSPTAPGVTYAPLFITRTLTPAAGGHNWRLVATCNVGTIATQNNAANRFAVLDVDDIGSTLA